MRRSRRRWAIALAVTAAALVAAVLAFQLALRQMHGRIEAALGPRATLQSLSLGWTGIELRGLRVRAALAPPSRWPAAEELSAQTVRIAPALSSLWRPGWQIASVTVEGGSVSMLRTKDGRLRVLPSLLESDAAPKSDRAPGARTSVRIGELRLRDVTIDFFDASVATPAHRIRLQSLKADVGPLSFPALDEAINVSLQATLRGPQRHGKLTLEGQLTPATRDADVALRAKGVDLVALSPYLLRSNEAAVRRGTLDMSLDARVKAQRLNAPGRLTLTDLELAGGGGMLGTFAGVPRQAVLTAMSRDGRIELAFTLEGRVDDPKFSVNELFAARFAVGLAEKLGVSIGGVVEGVGGVIKGLFGR